MNLYPRGFYIRGPTVDGEVLYWVEDFGWGARDTATAYYDLSSVPLLEETGREPVDA